MRTGLGASALFAAVAALLGCGPPTCKPVPVSLPSTAGTVPWLDGGYAAVTAGVDGQDVSVILDTGFDETSFGAGVTAPAQVSLSLGGASAGPLSYGLLDAAGGVLGNDVLYQLPLVHDARARATTVSPAFTTPPADATSLVFLPTGQCRDDSRAELGPLGPYSFVVPVTLEGAALQMVLDTGAGATFLRGSLFDALSTRPTLSGVLVATPFAGVVSTTAARATTLSVGSATSADSVLLTAPQIDQELDQLTSGLASACSALHCPAAPKVDGFLGWTFLREFLVSLDGATAPTQGRTVALSRFDTQTHWTRDFVGIGVVTAPSSTPGAVSILAFLSVSPAKDAGLQVGDVITTVNGAPASEAPTPYAPAGTPVMLGVARGTQSLSVTVTVEDLLPNPP